MTTIEHDADSAPMPALDTEAEEFVLGAAMSSRDALAVARRLSPNDFTPGKFRDAFQVVIDLDEQGAPVTPETVRAELERRGAPGGHGVFVFDLFQHAAVADAAYWADKVAEAAQSRRVLQGGQRLVQLSGAEPSEERRQAILATVDTLTAAIDASAPAVSDPVWELDAYLGQDEPEYDWLVPGLLERGDRLIITGAEGGGKSTLLRQFAVQAASGLHPFGGDDYAALRVLLLDLENSARHVRRELRPLRIAAGIHYAGTMAVHVRPQGLDVLQPDDAAWLRALVAHTRPDMLITGPTYKLAAGDPTEERTARTVAAHLDHLRAEHGCAVIIEAHVPYAGNGARRPERPYGASLWSRWPEFGLYLDGGTGELRHWRGARDERDWPAALQRGGHWPWTPVTRARDIVWAQIVEHCIAHGRPSQRALAKALGVGLGSVQRAISEHADDWEALA